MKSDGTETRPATRYLAGFGACLSHWRAKDAVEHAGRSSIEAPEWEKNVCRPKFRAAGSLHSFLPPAVQWEKDDRK